MAWTLLLRRLPQRGFDDAMRDTLDAGKPGPAPLVSEEALCNAYVDWPTGQASQRDSSRDRGRVRRLRRKPVGGPNYQRMLKSGRKQK
jgi:hypothetical protein